MSYFRHAAQSLADALDFSAAQLALAAAPFPAAERSSAAGSNPAAGEDRPAAGREWLNGFSQPQDPLAARTVLLTPLLSERTPVTPFSYLLLFPTSLLPSLELSDTTVYAP